MSFSDRFDEGSIARERADSTFSNPSPEKGGESLEGATGLAMHRKTWTRDKDAKHCMSCGTGFTLKNRKHHCRSCGGVFCGLCTKHRETLQKLTEKGTKVRESARVCARCSANHAIEREEPLFKLLGPELGPTFYYRLKRHGHGEIQSFSGLSEGQMNEVFTKAEIPEIHRADISKKLREFTSMIGGGGGSVIRSAVITMQNNSSALDVRGSSNINTTTSTGLSPPTGFSPNIRITGGPANSFEEGSLAMASSGPFKNTPLQQPSVPISESPRPRASFGAVFSDPADRKQFKKKWADELAQMEVDKEHMVSQLHVLDASISTQKQTLTRLKQLTDEEEAKHGKIEENSEELFRLKTDMQMRDDAEARRLDDMKSSTEASDADVVRRRKDFLRGQHRCSNCSICLKSFTLMKREHHCRKCYRSCCGICSSLKGKGRDTRTCDWCTTQTTLTSRNWTREITDSREFRLTNYMFIKTAISSIQDADPSTVQTRLGKTASRNTDRTSSDNSSSEGSESDLITDARIATMRAKGLL